MLPIDYEQLDPGIREIVQILRINGFDTCDSALPYPHVYAKLEHEYKAFSECRRMLMCLPEGWEVQLTFNPSDGLILLMARNNKLKG